MCLTFVIWYVCSYLRHKHKFSIMSRLSDFVTCSASFNIQSDRSIFQLFNIVGKIWNKILIMFIRHSNTQIVNSVV